MALDCILIPLCGGLAGLACKVSSMFAGALATKVTISSSDIVTDLNINIGLNILVAFENGFQPVALLNQSRNHIKQRYKLMFLKSKHVKSCILRWSIRWGLVYHIRKLISILFSSLLTQGFMSFDCKFEKGYHALFGQDLTTPPKVMLPTGNLTPDIRLPRLQQHKVSKVNIFGG